MQLEERGNSGSREARQLAVVVLLLLGIGLVLLYSASAVAAQQSARGDSFYFFRKQVLWAALALGVFAVTARIPFEFWKKARFPLFAVTLLLLALVLVPGIGSPINGARRWLHAGGWAFQPSELAKLTCAFFVCGHMAEYPDLVRHFRWGFLPAFAAIALTCGLIVVEPDLGTAAFLGLVMTLTLIVGGTRWMHLALPAGLGTAALVGYAVTHLSHVMPRIEAWLHPEADPFGKGHQIRQSLIALGAGGWWGEGLGRGVQKLFFLPEVHSDFIFPVLGEELGFLGAVSVLCLYVAFGVAGWKIVRRARSDFGFLLAFSLTMCIVLQAALNLMVVTALVPTKGIPLPFLSFGGSSLCFSMASAGILVNIAGRTEASPGWLAGTRDS
ncbi:MAG: putative lipid II flippase FtsW [Planctomycetes bacterium]|nr:putative lipid II flippase FtsW [Planctomycetota bacterium]